MKRLTLATALLACSGVSVLAAPSAALAASHGVVLSVDRGHHKLQLVDARHVVHDYGYRGRLPAVSRGTRVSYTLHGQTVSHVAVSGTRARTVSFYGRVVRSSAKGLVLRLSDGRQVSFTKRQLSRAKASRTHSKPKRHAVMAHLASDGQPSITLNIRGLEPGVTVLVSESTDASGATTITITLPPPAVPGVTSSMQSDGVVTDVGTDTFTLQTDDGSDLRLHVSQNVLNDAALSVCDAATVTYHQDAGLLVADRVTDNGASSSADCADGGGDGGASDVTGTITAVSGQALTVSTDQGPMSFVPDTPDVVDGFTVGDEIDVTYDQNNDGTLDAFDVEWVESVDGGTVTAVTDSALTIAAEDGSTQTFVGDPGSGVFDGVTSGDQVEVSYHQSGGQQVADGVADASAGDGPSSDS